MTKTSSSPKAKWNDSSVPPAFSTMPLMTSARALAPLLRTPWRPSIV